ncbi:MAG: P-II family nitrogen regulator [bacterium]
MSQILFLVLNKEEYLDDVLTAFVEADITGATIINSSGMGRVLATDVPIFASLRQAMTGKLSTSPYNKTIFTVVKDDEQLNTFIELLKDIIDLDTPGTGLLFVLPVTMVKGLSSKGLSF